MIIGYARVSTEGQSLKNQLERLEAAGCDKIHKEKQSGANDKRPALKRCLKSLAKGDTLLFTSLDRVARSTRHLLQIVEELDERGVMLKSLGQSWVDTTTPEGRLMITVFAGLAEFERSMIIDRTSAGREAAKKRGVKFGRKPSMNEKQKAEALKMLADGRRGVEVAALFDVSEPTISRLKKSADQIKGDLGF
jgi:DNA invertase Pin-like site-specific DNA recombinase